MKINISYFLDEHGWSTSWIYANGKFHEISITHVYGEDPIEEFLNSLIGIIKGEVERKFTWYGEPGGDIITIKEIPTKKHMVNFKVEGFAESYGEVIKDLEVRIEFEIKKKQLVRMLYFEFKKIFELMKDNHFEENRKNNFPFQKFRDFEKIVVEYIELN
jgi:hypothetical protein